MHVKRQRQYRISFTVIGKHFESEIITDIQKAMFLSIIADEVTDVPNKEQCSICIRYVPNNDVNETFISFVEVERITRKVLPTTILQCLESCSLSPSDLRSQCYDDGLKMAGERSGRKAVVQAQGPNAIYVLCAAHWLNLALVSACKIQEFQNTELCMGERARLFRLSAKRQRFLEKAADVTFPKKSDKN